MRRRLALTVGLALTGCNMQQPVRPTSETVNPSIPSAMPGSGVTVPGNALSAMPVTGHGGPMQVCGNQSSVPAGACVDQTGSQAVGNGPAQYRRGGPATIQ